MDTGDLFSGGEVGFKFIPFDVLADKVGVHQVALRFFTALLAGKYGCINPREPW